MPGKQPEEKYITISFDIETEKSGSFYKCQGDILQKVIDNVPIPAELIEEFIGYIVSKEDDQKKELHALCSKVHSLTVEFFSTQRDYRFKAKRNGRVFDLSKCIDEVLRYYVGSIWIHEQMEKTTDKNKSIQSLFVALAIYSRYWNKSPRKLLISNYKKAVIAAFITHHLGHHVLMAEPDGTLNTTRLFKASWDAVKGIVKLPFFKQYLTPIK